MLTDYKNITKIIKLLSDCMKKVMFFCIGFLFLFIHNDVFAAECEFVMDADSGRVLYSKNASDTHLIASTTKIMTALVALNNGNLKDVITADEIVLDAYGSSIYLKVGEKMTLEDLLYGLMLRSGNDAALVIAKHIGGSVSGFVALMNETAKAIGMENTNFSNPHGLDEENENTSTVYDMALLMREAMKNETFRKITSTKKYTLKTNFNTYEWYNKNELLNNYEYATGGKIGYTIKAKHTFVSSATKDDKNLIVATFVDPDRFKTHENLYEKYFEKYERYTLIDKDNLDIDYKKGYRVFTMSTFDMLLNNNELEKVNREVVLYSDVKIGNSATIIGNVSIKIDDTVYKKMNIYAVREKQEKKSLLDKIKEFFKWSV